MTTINTQEYWTVDTPAKFHNMISYLEPRQGYLAVDTECTSANALTCSLLGISLSMGKGEAFYVKFASFDGETVTEVDWSSTIRVDITRLLENPNKKLIMHNSPYDVLVLNRNIGVDCMPYLHADTILMKHLVDEQRPHGLKESSIKYLGHEWGDGIEALKESVLKNGGKWTQAQKDFYKADFNILATYACADADMTLQLFTYLEQDLTKQKLTKFFYEEDMPLNEVTIDMHNIGIKVDVDYYQQLKTDLEKEAKDTEWKIHEELKNTHPDIYDKIENALLDKLVPIKPTGSLFNMMYETEGHAMVYNPDTGKPTFTKKVIEAALEDDPTSPLLQWRLKKITTVELLKFIVNDIQAARIKLFKESKGTNYVVNVLSNDQLGEILFTHLGEKAFKQTSKGKNKVDGLVLESFSTKYKFMALVLHLRKTNKLLSTYVEAALTQHLDGIIHPSWLQFGTTSGRYASRNPNYQNIPRKDTRIKKGIVSRPGRVLVGADYSQLEPRCFAHCSKETSLIQSFMNGDDLYGTIAVKIFKLSCTPNEVATKHPDKREITKTIALAVTYGAKEWKIAKILNTTTKVAKKIIADYFKAYPGLERYILTCHGQVLSAGKVINETGRIRHLEDILSVKNVKDRISQNIYRNYLNLSVNFPIQSLAASIVNRAMIAIRNQFKEEGLSAYIVMQVHDEIIAECPEEDAKRVCEIMKDKMENTYKLRVPLIAEPKIGHNLSETK